MQLKTKDKILILLNNHPHSYLAVHEIPIKYFSIYGCYMASNENAIASRLGELANEGKVRSRRREGKMYKEWQIVIKVEQLNLFVK